MKPKIRPLNTLKYAVLCLGFAYAQVSLADQQSLATFQTIHSVYLANLDQSFAPSRLCLEGRYLIGTELTRYCTEWSVGLREMENGKTEATFSNIEQALEKSESSNGLAPIVCSQETLDYPIVPIVDTFEKCVAWDASGNCSAVQSVTRRAPTTFKISTISNPSAVTSHEYPIQSCSSVAFPTRRAKAKSSLAELVSSGEWSGGNVIKKKNHD